MLDGLHRSGDGDCGICFEYAVHDAVTNGDQRVVQRIHDAARLCNVQGVSPTSILFGLEKTGALQLIDTVQEILTEDSRLKW